MFWFCFVISSWHIDLILWNIHFSWYKITLKFLKTKFISWRESQAWNDLTTQSPDHRISGCHENRMRELLLLACWQLFGQLDTVLLIVFSFLIKIWNTKVCQTEKLRIRLSYNTLHPWHFSTIWKYDQTLWTTPAMVWGWIPRILLR